MTLLLGCKAVYSVAHANGENFWLQLANMSNEKVHDIHIITEDPRLGELLGGDGGWIAAHRKPAGGGVSFSQDNELDVPKYFLVKWRTPDGVLHEEELHLNVPEGKERDKYMPHRERCWDIIIGFTDKGVTYGWTMTECPTAKNQYKPRPVVYGGSRELLIFTDWFLTSEEAERLPYWGFLDHGSKGSLTP